MLGLLMLLAGEGFLEEKILKSMALTEGSDRTESWLRPPVQPHLESQKCRRKEDSLQSLLFFSFCQCRSDFMYSTSTHSTHFPRNFYNIPFKFLVYSAVFPIIVYCLERRIRESIYLISFCATGYNLTTFNQESSF